ncbi:hypothetical protein [Undibacterium crateris]|uniref:hypothetical protein n=1 Tax=Undibacterium crateris TaxID=2528175 RepID=UPI00138A32CA|nr:hypothetical protein [Undibacterium crateris]NDI85066.1 hypothetical protein [Undibacterium crateris]
MPNAVDKSKIGIFSKLGQSAKTFFNRNIVPAQQISEADGFTFNGGTTISALLGSGRRVAKARQSIYEKWSFMEGDPIVSSALMLLVTSALGGHETTGDVVFIEKTPIAEKDKRLGAIADEISADLSSLFNRVAYTSAYNGAAFGDSYARIYSHPGIGVTDLYVDELVRPTLVQPYERGSRTVGFMIYSGQKLVDRLQLDQMARLKMPRTLWVPQYSVVEKAFRMTLQEDDEKKLPILPGMVGGSFLYQAEEAYDNLYASLLGLLGQRWMDSIDEQMISINMQSMTSGQQDKFLKTFTTMLRASKQRAEDAVKNGRPVMERIRHLIPVFNEKQVQTISTAPNGAAGRGGTISVEDIMLHARMLSGALGVDLSMLGFADQLSGGLGDGGFFRVSAQAAERARGIRHALSEFFYSIIDIHTMKRYGIVFEPSNRPYKINFYGSISAMESEKAKTKSEALNSAALFVQALQQMKDLGLPKSIFQSILANQFLLDEELAKLYAEIADIKPEIDDGKDGEYAE